MVDAPLLISDLPPSAVQKRAAMAAALTLAALFAVAVMHRQETLPKIDAFIPVVATAMFLTDAITATLLLAQCSIVRAPALLLLASGYLFTALLIMAYALVFPGAFAPAGLLGAGPQSPPWLFSVWHVGLPASIIGYVLLNRFTPSVRMEAIAFRRAAAASTVNIVVLVCALTWFVTAHHDTLPALMQTSIRRASGAMLVGDLSAVLAVCTLAVGLLLAWRRSMLDLWLLVASFAWLLDSILLAIVQERYTVAWYANRFFAITAAALVLFVLLSESTMLYARLALYTLAQRREREHRLMSMEAVSAAIEHEVRQPLGAIATNAASARSWLQRESPDIDEACLALDGVESGAERSADVVHSIRELFGKPDPDATPVDVDELIRETIAMLHDELDAARIEVRLDLATDGAQLHAHRGQLQQVLLNLVGNAADAMRGLVGRPAVLGIVTRRHGSNGVVITVADTGIGIPDEDTERIFDAFYTTKPQGMGMGLVISRSIVEAHGGALTVSPGTPEGTVFEIVIAGDRDAPTSAS
jgi:signal transduction histidine kinase